jgi:hypothetical protein
MVDGWVGDGIIRRRESGGVARMARAGWMDGLNGCAGLDFDPADARKTCSRQSAAAGWRASAWSSASKRHE